MDAKDLSTQELLRLCLETQDAAAWEEFVRCTQPLIARVVARTIRRLWRKPDSNLTDDLVQETYRKFLGKNLRALREFKCDHDDPHFDAKLFGYIKTVASNVVRDYKRHIDADKHGGGFEVLDLEAISAFLPAPTAHPDRQVLISQILDCLHKLKDEPSFQRDWAIFHLYFFDGLTAKAISTLPSIDLEVKGVESTLLRMVRRIRECLGRAPK